MISTKNLGYYIDLLILLFLLPIISPRPLQAQPIWRPVKENTSNPESNQGFKSKNTKQYSTPTKHLVWEIAPFTETKKNQKSGSIIWVRISENESPADRTHLNTTVVWEAIQESDTPLVSTHSENLAKDKIGASANEQEAAPPEVVAQEAAMPPRIFPGPPPPPPIQALNRSVAFGDGLVGPDISLRIPNGFRWSQRWFGDVSILGYDYQNGRNPGDPFIPARDSGDLDGWGIIHANILQTTNWSVALNTSFRSLQNNPDIPGGSTGIEDGVSSGFRIARAIGDTGGIAFGGEQVIQWDDNTDTGRNLYLMASNGWWLGDNGKDYPLFIANGGLGTGRFASLTDKDEPFNFTCTPVESNRKVGKVDENLCWGPIGSVSLVFDEWWGTFVEYAIGRATLGISANLTGGIPLRVTAGVHFAENDEIVSFDELRWITQFSIGF
ncbi:hypothetical protein [Synechococcus sp. RS9916]|uniref:hypothetical protein n=1 Tax=Synechococcus sp. RS9916 TaxID=221359 RepID=UPI0012EA474E|nr:hypothetical protein [Synechococcus sp. RS9916]